MGGTTFFQMHSAKDARTAFNEAVGEARYEHGHGGYSGTIAEKTSYTMIPLPAGKNASDEAERLIDEGDARVDNKWGPAGCFDCGPDPVHPALRRYAFFGWASD